MKSKNQKRLPGNPSLQGVIELSDEDLFMVTGGKENLNQDISQHGAIVSAQTDSKDKKILFVHQKTESSNVTFQDGYSTHVKNTKTSL